MSRTGYALKNVFVGVGGQIFSILIGIVTRVFFVRLLAEEYLGLNGLFSSILTALSFVELGIGPAIVYSLYKPLAERDQEQIQALMSLFRKAYILIGIAVAVIGAALTPFLPYLIDEMPENIPHIEVIYLLFVANTSVSYFFSYKRSLIIADQKQYITTAYHYAFYFVMNILQIIFLYITRNYFAYLILMIAFTLLENIAISMRANRMFPVITEQCTAKLNPVYKKEITTNVKSIILHKIGGIASTAIDNILMGKMFGLIVVGIYSNYLLIISPLNAIGGQIFSFTASLGNLKVTTDDDRAVQVFRIMEFIDFWVYSFAAVCLFVLFNPFIEIAFGEKFLFPMVTVSLIVLNFYIEGRRKAILSLKDAYGIFYQDRYKPIAEAVTKVTLSVFLGWKLGVNGIFLGTLISKVICIVVEPYVVYKYGIGWEHLVDYVKKYLLYLFLFVSMAFLTYALASLCGDGGLLSFLGKMAVCLVFPNVVVFLLFRKTTEFAWISCLMQKVKLKFKR
ncbi:MAG: lipopolysaccharide biosynthesis protein [Clostridia bacterium]